MDYNVTYDDLMGQNNNQLVASLAFYSSLLGVYTVIAMILLIKIRFRLEKNALINMVLFFTALLTLTVGTMVDLIVKKQSLLSWVDIFNSNSDFCVQLTLFVFVFEMRSVYIKVESETQESCKARLQKNIRVKYAFVISSLLLNIALNVIYVRVFIYKKVQSNLSNPISLIFWAVKILQSIMDILVLGIFTKLFFYFYTEKIKRMKENNIRQTCKMHLIVAWIIFNVILQVTNTFLQDFVNPWLIYDFFVEYQFLIFYGKYRFFYFDFTDFILGITLLYFFYHLGKFNQSMHKAQFIDDHPMREPSQICGQQTSGNISQNDKTIKNLVWLLNKNHQTPISIKTYSNPSLNNPQECPDSDTSDCEMDSDLQRVSYDLESNSNFGAFLLSQIIQPRRTIKSEPKKEKRDNALNQDKYSPLVGSQK